MWRASRSSTPVVARRAADGSFAGIVSVALRPSYFDAFYRELLGGSDSTPMAIGLTRADGAMLAQYPRAPARTGGDDAEFAVGRSVSRKGGGLASCEMRSGIDDDNVIVAFRRGRGTIRCTCRADIPSRRSGLPGIGI